MAGSGDQTLMGFRGTEQKLSLVDWVGGTYPWERLGKAAAALRMDTEM